MHSGEDVGEASLSLPPKNVGEDTLPSSPVVLASSPVLDTGGAADATATVDMQMKKVGFKLWLRRRPLGHLLKDLLL